VLLVRALLVLVLVLVLLVRRLVGLLVSSLRQLSHLCPPLLKHWPHTLL
jgi:hypothetical protein